VAGGEQAVARHDALRWVRALTLACVMLAAGVSGHAAGGGGAPPIALLGPVLLVLTLAASPFLDAPASSTRVAALVLAAQAALHVLLEVVGTAPATGAAPMRMPAAAGHSMPPAMPAHSTHLGMLAAHVAAALAVALWLAAGERAAWSLLAVVGLAFSAVWNAVLEAVSPRPALVLTGPRATSYAWGDHPALPSLWDGVGGLSRRGPPAACAA
jgi:hypothetical protein